MGNENSAMLVSYLLQISYALRAEFGAESAILDDGLFTQRVARPASMIMINSTCNSAGDSTRATRAVPRAARIMNRWYCRRPAKPCRPSRWETAG